VKVLSLFDGISCGRLALDILGVNVSEYVAYEIDSNAIKVSKDNYPSIIHHSDVRDCNGKDYTDFDLLIGGSPCQDLSGAQANREGLDGKKSSLFFEYVRVLEEMSPRFYFFENVGSMSKEDEEIISGILGSKPIKLNSKDFSPSLRNRYYWTNIPQTMLCNREDALDINDILESGYSNRKKARSLLASDSRPLATPIKMVHRYLNTGFTTLIFKDVQHYVDCNEQFLEHFKGLSASKIDKKIEEYSLDVSIFDGVRYMSQVELERCMGIPDGYTKTLSRNKAAHHIGNAWNIPTIVHLMRGLLTN
jgi:DNA (cytosine-5)-methyltransferase 3A